MSNNGKQLEKVTIAWHPAFCSATEFELREAKENLEFEPEYSLSKEPLRIDLLVIKKNREDIIENDIARIFRKYNIVEYKSPEDGLTIDDLYKTIGYACLYKGTAKTVNEIPAGEVTVSLFRESYPQALMVELERSGVSVKETALGVYHLAGIQFPAQIVVTGQLDSQKYSALKILSKSAQRADIEAFLRIAQTLETSGELQIVDSILQVSVSANRALYQEIKEDETMCQALKSLMREEILEERNKEKMFERCEIAKNLWNDGMCDVEKIAKLTRLTTEQVHAALRVLMV